MNKLILRKITLCAVLSAFATITFVIENLFPPIVLPGAKMGLSNVFILLSVLLVGIRYGFITLFVKTILGSLFAGNLSSIIYSLPAGLFALIIEVILLFIIKKVSLPAVSVAGAVINSSVQNLIFCLVTNSVEMLYYLPYLSLISVVTGFLIGLTVHLVIKRLPERLFLTLSND